MPTDDPPKPKPRRRRWPWVLAVLAGLVAAGPTLLGLTPLPASLLASQLPPEAGRLAVASVSLGWTGPIRATGLKVTDPEGAEIASAESVEVAAGLWTLATTPDAPVVIRVVRPRIELVLRPDGANFDPLLKALADKSAQVAADEAGVAPTSARRAIDATIESGAVLVTDADSGAQWTLEEVNARLFDPGLGIDTIEATAQGALAAKDAGNATAGELTLRIGAAEGGGRLAQLNANGLPLALVEPLLRGEDPSTRIAGLVGIDGQVAWDSVAERSPANGLAEVVRTLIAGGLRSSGQLSVSSFEWSGRAAPGPPIRLASVEVPWRVLTEDGALRLAQLDATSDIGRISASGLISVSEIERWAEQVAAAPRDLTVEGLIDLAPLGRLAPGLLRLRRDAQIDGGRVRANVRCEDGRIDARLASESIEGVAGGRRITLREPIDLRIAATQEAPNAGVAGWKLDRLQADSSFFEAEASGNAEGLTGRTGFNLDRLAAELRPIIDLGDVQLTGAGQAQFAVAREAAGGWRLNSQGRVRNLLVGPPAEPLAAEPDLTFQARLAGVAGDEPRLPAGRVVLTAGDDTLTVEFPPADGPGAQAFELQLAGDAARWYRRAFGGSPQLPAAEVLGLAGRVVVNASGAADARGGRLDACRIDLEDLSLDASDLGGPPLQIRGERVAATAAGTWRVSEGALRAVQLSKATLVTEVFSAGASDVLVSLERPDESAGRVDWQADLARLAAWTPRSARYAGSGLFRGTALVRAVPEGVNAKLNAEAQDLALIDRRPEGGGRPRRAWTEPTAEINADLMLTPRDADDGSTRYTLEVRDARVTSRSVTGSLGGQVADIAALAGVRLGGGVDYDLEQLSPILWPSLGSTVRLVGRDRATFRVETDENAPPDAAPITRFRASIAAPWEGANVFGLPVGPGRLAARLERGVLTLDPIDVALGGGRLTTAATATLEPPPGILAVPAGPMVTEVGVSPEVNERVLKFIAPVLADATRIDGRFSISLSELAVPLAAPTPGRPPAGRAAGVLDIHTVRVRPGPSAQEWVGVVRQIVALAKDGIRSTTTPSDTVLLRMQDAPVEFRMIDGRVYHRGLAFTIGDAVVESSGSVGLDETLDLVLSIPIQDAWVEREPVLLGRLRGQSLRVPIQGTLKNPKVNSSAFRQLSRQFLEGAAQGAIDQGLNLLLDRLRSR